MTANRCQVICYYGPFDNRTIEVEEPLPELLTIEYDIQHRDTGEVLRSGTCTYRLGYLDTFAGVTVPIYRYVEPENDTEAAACPRS